VDEFFDAMEDRLRAVARSSDHVAHDCATFDQVDLVIELREVARVIIENCQLIMVGGHRQWMDLAAMLYAAAQACANEAIIEQGKP
jgi:hypothetical protein